jgi:hypothetical protein
MKKIRLVYYRYIGSMKTSKNKRFPLTELCWMRSDLVFTLRYNYMLTHIYFLKLQLVLQMKLMMELRFLRTVSYRVVELENMIITGSKTSQ